MVFVLSAQLTLCITCTLIIYNTNNLRGDNNFNIAMNRMKAADITQLRYLFDLILGFQ